MCSIAMPTELMVGHGTAAMYNPIIYRPFVSPSTRTIPPRIRSCLSTGSLPLHKINSESNNNNNNCNDINKRRKRVVFADDHGRPLAQIRVMSEPSNMPPLWSAPYSTAVCPSSHRNIHQLQKAASFPLDNHVYQPWEITFPQPASDYLSFRRRLDEDAVSLENVIVKHEEGTLVGTVKVRNLAYDKEVVVRVTTDKWTSLEDVYCNYVEQPGKPQAALVLYDTFRFTVNLPLTINTDRIEFCVRYRIDGREFWDNNGGNNYVIRRKQQLIKRVERKTEEMKNNFNNSSNNKQADDVSKLNFPTWSEFASWQHLNNDAPYW